MASADIFIMGSSGGMMTTQQAEQLPVATAVSGLAAGVMAGATVAQQSGLENLITLDVGGTSSDIALIHHHTAQHHRSGSSNSAFPSNCRAGRYPHSARAGFDRLDRRGWRLAGRAAGAGAIPVSLLRKRRWSRQPPMRSSCSAASTRTSGGNGMAGNWIVPRQKGGRGTDRHAAWHFRCRRR